MARTVPTGPSTAACCWTTTSILIVNAWWEPLTFTIPDVRTRADGAAARWQVELTSYDGTTGEGSLPSGPDGPSGPSAPAAVQPGGQVTVGPRSLTVLRAPCP